MARTSTILMLAVIGCGQSGAGEELLSPSTSGDPSGSVATDGTDATGAPPTTNTSTPTSADDGVDTGASAGDSSGDESGGPPPAPGCGDEVCDVLETCSACPADCGPCPSDCGDPQVLCVDDGAGPSQEFADIQSAADAAVAGDTVLVQPGSYAGFQISRSGEPDARISYLAVGEVLIDQAITSGDAYDGCVDEPTGICIVGSDELEGVHDVAVEGFHIVDMARSCIASHSANPGIAGSSGPHQRIVVREILCERAGHEGLYLSEVGASLVEANEIIDAGADGQPRGHGIYMANAGCDDTIIRANAIHWDGQLGPSEGAGIHFNGDESVDGNGGGDGIITGLVVEGNVIRGADHNGLNMDGVRASSVVGNIVHGNSRNAMVVYAIDASAGAGDLRIVGNTFVVPEFASGAAIRLEQDDGGHVIFDNILINESGGPSISLGNAEFTSDYNAVIDAFAFDEGDMSLAQWQAQGRDTHSLVVASAEVFVDADDLHLRADAPTIDVGVASLAGVDAPSYDIDGDARPHGAAFDLGADERSR